MPPPFAQDCAGHECRRALASGRMLGGNLWLWGMWQHPSHIPFEDGSVGGNSFPFAKLNRIYDWQLPCPESHNHPMSCQVTKFWQIMLQDDFLRDGPTKTKMYADSWGIRKLISHALRNLRQDRSPRAPWLHVIISKKILDVRYFQNMNRCVGFWTSWTPLFWECCGFCLSKSRGVQHLNMIFIRAWYIQTPQQPPPPGVAAIADDDVVYGDSEDWLNGGL